MPATIAAIVAIAFSRCSGLVSHSARPWRTALSDERSRRYQAAQQRRGFDADPQRDRRHPRRARAPATRSSVADSVSVARARRRRAGGGCVRAGGDAGIRLCAHLVLVSRERRASPAQRAACRQAFWLFGTPPLPLTLVRILVVSALYPPVAFGGYEVECSGVVERLRERGEVLVLTSDLDRDGVAAQTGVRRELARLTPRRARGAPRTRGGAACGARSARRARVGAGPGVRLERRVDPAGGAAGARRQRGAARVSRVRALVRRPLHRRPVHARAVAGTPRAGAGRLGRGLSRAERAAGAAAGSAGAAARGDLLELGGDQADGARAALRRARARARGPLGPALRGRLRTPSCASRRPTRRSCSSGASRPYKGLFVAIEALALLRSEHAIPARLVVIGPEDAEHGAELRGLAAAPGRRRGDQLARPARSASWSPPSSRARTR